MDRNLNTSMKINITQKAREFLQKAKKNDLYIERLVVTDCCVPLATPPTVTKGRPRKQDDYHIFEVDGLTVFYDRNLISKPEITIDTQKFGFIKGLIVTDWVIKY